MVARPEVDADRRGVSRRSCSAHAGQPGQRWRRWKRSAARWPTATGRRSSTRARSKPLAQTVGEEAEVDGACPGTITGHDVLIEIGGKNALLGLQRGAPRAEGRAAGADHRGGAIRRDFGDPQAGRRADGELRRNREGHQEEDLPGARCGAGEATGWRRDLGGVRDAAARARGAAAERTRSSPDAEGQRCWTRLIGLEYQLPRSCESCVLDSVSTRGWNAGCGRWPRRACRPRTCASWTSQRLSDAAQRR